MPASCRAVRTATRSVGSETTSKLSPKSLTLLPQAVLFPRHPPLAAEQVGHRAGVGHVATVAGHRHPHLTGRPVAIVGQTFDHHRHTVGPVPLVPDGLV